MSDARVVTFEIKSGKRRRLKKKVKIRMAIFLFSVFAVLICYSPVRDKINAILHPAPVGTVRINWYKDLNPVHLKYAKQNGIPAFKTNDEFSTKIQNLVKQEKLVKISDNQFYRVCLLTYSHPYLTPEAKKFLNDLGKRFREKLEEKKMPAYYFQISSLIRTRENQKNLSRGNENASSNSSHLYGTTFDIPYFTVVKKTFLWKEAEVSDGNASKLLSESIGELRKEGRCVVVTEKNERCFHITVTQ